MYPFWDERPTGPFQAELRKTSTPSDSHDSAVYVPVVYSLYRIARTVLTKYRRIFGGLGIVAARDCGNAESAAGRIEIPLAPS